MRQGGFRMELPGLLEDITLRPLVPAALALNIFPSVAMQRQLQEAQTDVGRQRDQLENDRREFAGSTCREASRFLEQALDERTGEYLTAEFHQAATTQQQQQQQA